MPVPKRKRSKARRDKRFANKGIKVTSIVHCSQCKAPLVPHQACKKCGFYKGAKVMETKADRGVKRTEIKAQKKTTTQEAEPQETEQ